MTGGWEWENADLSLFDFGHVEVAANVESGTVKVGAIASLYSPSASFDVFGVTISIGAELGAIGGFIDCGTNSFKASGAYGIGLSLSIEW